MNKRIKKKKAKQEAERLAVEEQERIAALRTYIGNKDLEKALPVIKNVFKNIFEALAVAFSNISDSFKQMADSYDVDKSMTEDTDGKT